MDVDYQLNDLRDESVFITGGGSGIGAAIAEAFLAQGSKVAFVDVLDTSTFCDQMMDKYGARPLAFKGDIRDIESLQKSIKSTEEENGPIGVLINNAAQDTRHTLSELSVDEWDDSLAINLRPHFFTAQAVADSMRKKGSGAIVNLTSNSALLGLSGYPAYVAAKAGIMGLTKALATEVGPDNIRVNCLAPGWVMTERQKELWVTQEAIDECLDQQSLKHLIQPADVASTVLFLASSMSSMITGQMLVVDGGRV